ncbi:hypothetical protein B0T20DRAFT_437075 [Sordaria brevicollis]|uniref:Uncharacterized protein n=1 Tax=Sordaria brevicollis TaxID=83679 RepID=A0AAE0PEZ9_SORBR|nr:hypothetical protein B0T20DRAFT_437075 [Sordaria brevicollis]
MDTPVWDQSRLQANHIETQRTAEPTNDGNILGRLGALLKPVFFSTQHQRQIDEISAELASREAYFQREISELKAQNAEMARDWNILEDCYTDRIVDVDNEREHLAAELAESQNIISTLKTQIANMETEWRQKNSQYQDVVSSLEAQNHNNASKAADLQLRFDAACADFSKELAEAKSKNSFQQVKATDTEIKSSWKDLSFLVRQFIKEHCPSSFSPSMLQKGHVVNRLPDLKQFCLNPPSLLQSPFFAHSLFETCVWWYLYKTIFDPQADYWGGKIGRGFMSACTSLGDLISSKSSSQASSSLLPVFHQWRSDSIHYLQKFGVFNPPPREVMAAKMVDNLAPILNLTQNGTPAPAAIADALEIIRAAVRLDEIFRMSKADYTVIISKGSPPSRPPYFGFPFDPACMEQKSEFAGFGDRNGSHLHTVDLVVSPAILKAGNNEGENYHSKQFLVKLGVVCNVQRFLAAAQKAQDKTTSSARQDEHPSSTPTVCTRSRAKSLVEGKRPSDKSEDGSDVDMLDYPGQDRKIEDR